jgi:hypothetical protein
MTTHQKNQIIADIRHHGIITASSIHKADINTLLKLLDKDEVKVEELKQ